MKRRWIISGVLVLIALGVAGYFVYAHFFQSKAEDIKVPTTTYRDSSDTLKHDLTDKDTMVLVEAYGGRYQDALNDLARMSTKDWGAKQIDEAHMSLLYADKMGISTQAVSLYRQISSAKAQGVDVDSNPAGLTQNDRDKIYERNKEAGQ